MCISRWAAAAAGTTRTFVNLFIVWALTGLWHGAAWNYVLWGLYYFVLLIAERLIGEARLARVPRVLRHVLTMALVTLGWVLFAIEDFSALARYLHAMFALSGGLIGAQAVVWVLSYLPLFLVAVLASLPLAARLVQRHDQARFVQWGAPVWCLLLLAASCAALVAQSYNPFLYFRF